MKRFLHLLRLYRYFYTERTRYSTRNPDLFLPDFRSNERKDVLKKIFICPSHACNAQCVHCYEKFLHDSFGESLTVDQVRDIIDQFVAMGGRWVLFCSGEFLLHRNAVQMVRYASQNRLFTSIVTNGLLLDEEMMNRLSEAGLTNLVVSIDSADPARHDELRGVAGCFEKAVNGLRMAKERGMMTFLWSYITRTNANELEGVRRLADELGVTNVFVYFPLLSGMLFDRFDENLTAEERESYRRQFGGLPRLMLEFTTEEMRCTGGGMSHVAVMPTGDITFCPPVPYSYGNIKDEPLRDVVRRVRQDYRRFCIDGECRGQCPVNFPEYREHCNGRFMYG